MFGEIYSFSLDSGFYRCAEKLIKDFKKAALSRYTVFNKNSLHCLSKTVNGQDDLTHQYY